MNVCLHPKAMRGRALRSVVCLVLVLSGGLVCSGFGDEDADTLDTLDALVGRWMALRTTIAEETRDWDARRAQWNTEIELLEREAGALKAEVEKLTHAKGGDDENENAGALEQLKNYHYILEQIDFATFTCPHCKGQAENYSVEVFVEHLQNCSGGTHEAL